MKKIFTACALLLLAATATAHAAAPDMIGAGFGAYDFDKDNSRTAVDYRLDYQWGLSLVPMIDPGLNYLDQYFQLHPVAGFEGTGDGASFVNGGLSLDVPLVYNFIFTWGEAIGYYGHGDSRQPLGSPFEIRSQVELGYEFANQMRLSGYFSHLSNAGAGDNNPGAEIVGGYLRVPVGWLGGH